MTPLGLYVHWPFCQAKCPYCDFNSHVSAEVDQDRWADALRKEILRYRQETGPRDLHSVFFGGGTPSLMTPRTVAAVLDAAARAWRFEDGIEITLEANPTSVEAGRFRGYRAAGVNRVSLGVQALDDGDLRRLGRMHSAAEALAAVELARQSFERVSFDLIYARQHQDVSAWEAELSRALDLGPDHVSLYQLTIEPGTAFHARFRAGGLAGLPDEDRGADLWEATQALCASRGLPAYEVSNHARPGAQSRHNLLYWRGQDWIGIGPGAHGRFGQPRVATETALSPAAWLDAVETGGSGEIRREALDPREIAADRLMMGLRLSEGVPLADLAAIRSDAFDSDINDMEDSGLIECNEGVLRATSAGRPVLNAILRRLLPD